MTRSVTIVDYGIGNLFSVTRAFEVNDATVEVAATYQGIEHAERLVLPGVGAFEDGMKGLRERGQIEPLLAFIRSGRPFLGICVGMQLLLDVGEEFGEHAGLGIISGRVVPIPRLGSDGRPHRIPHIGWNQLTRTPQGSDWESGILRGLPSEPSVYFVHSFTPVPMEESHRLADSYYDGCRISAVIQKNAVFGTQFHPEKSGPLGLRIIENFLLM